MNEKIKNWLGNNEELYQKYRSFSQRIPFNVVKFVEDYLPDISLIESVISQKGVRGFIKEEDDGKIYICVHKFDSPTGKRFTIAHELGHYFRHRDEIKNGFVDGIAGAIARNGDFSRQEKEANEFAAELLMPELEFSEIFKEKHGNLAEIAEFFIVSEAAAYTRAKILQLINKEELSYFC